MLDGNDLRAEFALYLTKHTHTRWGLDAALMHVCRKAYDQGLADRVTPPPLTEVLRDRIARGVKVENVLAAVVSGSRPALTVEECRALASILGVPSEYHSLLNIMEIPINGTRTQES